MCCPASVSYTDTGGGFLIDMREEMADFSDFTDETRIFIFFYGDKTCRVIASVFEIFESLIEERFWVVFANGGDDSAHRDLFTAPLYNRFWNF